MVDPLAPNFVINHRLSKFKAKDGARGINLYEDISTDNLIITLPKYLSKELRSNIDKEYGKIQIGKSQTNFNENDKLWRKDYIFNGLLKSIYMYTQYIWLYFYNTDDDKMYDAYKRLHEIYFT